MVALIITMGIMVFRTHHKGAVPILRNHFPELRDWILRPEVTTVGFGHRPQHLWSRRNPYSRPEAATVDCARRAQDSISHRWLLNTWMFPYFSNSLISPILIENQVLTKFVCTIMPCVSLNIFKNYSFFSILATKFTWKFKKYINGFIFHSWKYC